MTCEQYCSDSAKRTALCEDMNEVKSMKAIDRVMAAYTKTHKLTKKQTAFVRESLSEFVDELLHTDGASKI